METDKNNNKNTSTNDKATKAHTNIKAPDLWDRIMARHPGLVADLAFVGRLRAEGALRETDPGPLILEYLRFAYLAWTDPAGATPSKAVDEVWHVHILFTRSYAEFCRATRGGLLHHDPGGGEADEARFAEAYQRTIARYAAEFGDPPGRYWPRPAEPPKAEVPKPEPPQARPPRAAPPPSGSGISSLEIPLVLSIIAGAAVFAVSHSLFTAFVTSLIGVMGSAFVLAAKAAEDPARRPARRASRSSDGGSGGGEGAAIVGGDAGCAPGDGGSCGDGGGSSCGSSCGGGGCGGG